MGGACSCSSYAGTRKAAWDHCETSPCIHHTSRLPVTSQLPCSLQHLLVLPECSCWHQFVAQSLRFSVSLLRGEEPAASCSPDPECPNPLCGTRSPFWGTRDIEDSPERDAWRLQGQPPRQPGEGPGGAMAPAPVAGRDVSLPSHVCVLAPLLPAGGGGEPVSPLNSLINISPWTMLHKLTLLLCQPLQGMGAQVLTGLLVGAGVAQRAHHHCLASHLCRHASIPAPERIPQLVVLPQDCSYHRTHTDSSVPVEGGKLHGSALSVMPAPCTVPASSPPPCRPLGLARARERGWRGP